MSDIRPKTQVTPAMGLMQHRGLITFFANIGIIIASYGLAFLLRFDFEIPKKIEPLFIYTLPAAVILQYGAFKIFHFTRGWWRYVGVADFLNAVKASVFGSLTLAMFVLFAFRHNYPRSIFILHPILLVGLSIGTRLVVRMWRQGQPTASRGPQRKLLVIGAGDTGEMLVREIRHSARLNYEIVAYLDDDKAKHGAYINGIPVLDGIEATKAVVERFGVQQIIVATPSASGAEMRRIIAACRRAGVPFKVMPATWEVLDHRFSLERARDVDINDLLRREPAQLDSTSIGRFLSDNKVLVTGAAGSIGSEICRQVLTFNPSLLICLDHDENALFELSQSLSPQEGSGTEIQFRLADVTDEGRIASIFRANRPDVVYHAAAHKHVPVVEDNAIEGIRNNVFGTRIVSSAAGEFGAKAFVLISTDKAVNPTNAMGDSKRIAELVLHSGLPETTKYTAVRFGNVLGSQGSVVPLFKRQIAQGGPVTVTHPEMKRFFMTIPEAVQLVIQASSMGKGQEIFTLDMGEPVAILDLAKDLITLSGLVPEVDIEIVFSGPRPGEKLCEELHLDAEHVRPTAHAQIYVAKQNGHEAQALRRQIEKLGNLVESEDEARMLSVVRELVPEYKLSEPPSRPARETSSSQITAPSAHAIAT